MANGILCRYCGWNEADHAERGHAIDPEDLDRVKEGYQRSLSDCSAFEPDELNLDDTKKCSKKRHR